MGRDLMPRISAAMGTGLVSDCTTLSFENGKYFPIVKDLKMTFVAPAATDVTVTIDLDDSQLGAIQADLDERGKADYGWNAELVDAAGTVVARSENSYQLRSLDLPLGS